MTYLLRLLGEWESAKYIVDSKYYFRKKKSLNIFGNDHIKDVIMWVYWISLKTTAINIKQYSEVSCQRGGDQQRGIQEKVIFQIAKGICGIRKMSYQYLTT